MDRSRIGAGIAGVRFVASPDELPAADEALVVVDVSRDGVLDHVGAIAGFVVAFGPHVDEAQLTAAVDAGCDLVLPRSKFFRRLPDLAREYQDPATG